MKVTLRIWTQQLRDHCGGGGLSVRSRNGNRGMSLRQVAQHLRALVHRNLFLFKISKFQMIGVDGGRIDHEVHIRGNHGGVLFKVNECTLFP